MKQIYETFDRFCGQVDRLCRFVLVGLITLIVVLLIGQVLIRSTLAIPLFWVSELTGYAFVYIALVGMGICLRSDQHVRMPLLLDALPDLLRRSLSIALNLIAICYAYYIGWYGYQFADLGATEQSASTYFILFWPRLALPIGGALLALQATCLILKELAGAGGPSGKIPLPQADLATDEQTDRRYQ